MDEMYLSPTPSKLVPVLIGGLAMTATWSIPVVNLVNCACCAGLMGGAILGVWFYRKSYPPEIPFTVGDGAIIGTLSGLVGAVASSIIFVLEFGLLSADFKVRFETQFEEVLDQVGQTGQDPEVISQIQDLAARFAESPGLLFLLVSVILLIIFSGFGALGGVIGGNLFKTKTVQIPPSGVVQ